MLAGIFELIEPDVLNDASRRVFNIRCQRFFVNELTFDESLREAVGSLGSNGVLESLLDTPALREWMWTLRRLRASLRGPGESLPMDALGHLCIDRVYAGRVGELLVHQLVGIVAGQALQRGMSFKYEAKFASPRNLYLDGIGLLSFECAGLDSSFEIVVRDDTFIIRSDGSDSKFRIGRANQQGRLAFTPTLYTGGKYRRISELALLNPSLTQPAFQPFPQLLGMAANRAWLDDIDLCLERLIETELPCVEFVLSQCKAMVGIVSLTEVIGSGSREEALGLVYLPAGTNLLDLAECILHESLHQLLFRIEETTPLFDSQSDAAERYYSPWRTDPRSLRMVLHGAFVFSGVATLHQLWTESPPVDQRFHGRAEGAYCRFRESAMAIETVRRHAVLTPVGIKVVSSIENQLRHVSNRLVLPGEARAGIDESIQAKRDALPSFIA